MHSHHCGCCWLYRALVSCRFWPDPCCPDAVVLLLQAAKDERKAARKRAADKGPGMKCLLGTTSCLWSTCRPSTASSACLCMTAVLHCCGVAACKLLELSLLMSLLDHLLHAVFLAGPLAQDVGAAARTDERAYASRAGLTVSNHRPCQPQLVFSIFQYL